MWISQRKEIRKLTFRALALRRREALTLETSAFEFLYGGNRPLSRNAETKDFARLTSHPVRG